MNEIVINNHPVKIWTNEVEDSAMEQIENLTKLPFFGSDARCSYWYGNAYRGSIGMC